jgi:hypothetical protein
MDIMKNYNYNKKEEWEKENPSLKGMEEWLVIPPDFLEIYLKAATKSDVKLDASKRNDGLIQLWCLPDQEMEEFHKELGKLKEANGFNNT